MNHRFMFRPCRLKHLYESIKETRSCEYGYLVRKIIYHEILLKAMRCHIMRLQSPFVTAGNEESVEERTNCLTNQENVIEFLKNSDTMTVTFSQGRFVSKVRELSEKFPDAVKIVAENADGSVVAHLPVSALHLSIIKREMTEEQKRAGAERLAKARENISNTQDK